MIQIVLIGIVMVGLTVMIHAMMTIWYGHSLIKKLNRHRNNLKSGYAMYILFTTVIILLMLLFTEAVTWSCLYFILSDVIGLKSFEEALYFSIVTFTTVGYGDITLQGSWRLLAGIEAMNGILLLGWSSASLYNVIRHLWANDFQNLLESEKKDRS
jgi:voltage-gated potassium channel